MKSLIVGILLLSHTAFAGAWGQYGGNVETQYLSWCDKNKIVSTTDNGQPTVLADCSIKEKSCEIKQIYQDGRYLFVGLCK
ncbi:MAG TPA: hypothetical protein VN132_11885 [Bdellovibrio sp.]|nr:hypothetical protein [Bdellovibrio sp.]